MLVLNYTVLSVAGSLTVISAGMLFGWSSPSLPQLQSETSKIKITSSEGSWLVSVTGIGSFAGAVLAAFLAARVGRKYCILMTSPLYFATWMMIAFASSYWVLISARVLNGVTDGLVFISVPMYLCEIADPEVRGLISAGFPVMTVTGFLLINVFGAFLDITKTACVCSLFPLIQFFSFCWMPDSPQFLIKQDRIVDAKKSFIAFNRKENVDIEFKNLIANVKNEEKFKRKYWELFTIKSNRKAIFIALVLRTIQQFCGVTAITAYANTIFNESGQDISPSVSCIIYFSIQTLAVILSSFLVDKIGRKPLILVSMAGSCLALSTLGTYFFLKEHSGSASSLNFIPITALVLYVVMSNVGLWSIPLLLFAELFPLNIQTYALALGEIHFGLSISVTAKFFQMTKDNLGMHVPFFTFAAVCLLGVAFVKFLVPETKGKTLEEIQNYLKGKTKETLNSNLDDASIQR